MSFMEWLDAMEADAAGSATRCGIPPPERCGLTADIPPPADFDTDQAPLLEGDDGGQRRQPRVPS